jgi:hypothetical protein
VAGGRLSRSGGLSAGLCPRIRFVVGVGRGIHTCPANGALSKLEMKDGTRKILT